MSIKILMLDFDLTYINNTRNLLRKVFQTGFETRLFGPGFVEKEILKQGVEAFIKKTGPYDIILATEHITLNRNWHENAIRNWCKNYYFKFDPMLILYAKEYADFFYRYPGLKIATLMETDFYHFSSESRDYLEGANAYLLGWGIEFFAPKSTLPELHLEGGIKNANDTWYEFIKKHKDKLMSCPHFLEESEFSTLPFLERNCNWSVVGSDYYYRQEARRVLTANNIVWKGNILRKLFSLIGKIKFNPYNKKYSLHILNYLFRTLIETTKYSYTDGSRLKYPIRKYMEIPALGSVLVCDPCLGFENLGFIDGVNAFVSAPGNLAEVDKILNTDLKRSENIAAAGLQMVRKNHTVISRSEQILRACQALLSKKFKGSYWENGQFIIEQ